MSCSLPRRLFSMTCVLAALLAFAACDAPDLDGHGNAMTADGDPAVSWTPWSLQFGTLYAGQTATLSVTLTSVGTTDLTIDYIDLDPTGSSAFALLDDPAPLTLPPGDTLEIEVEYAPTAPGYDSSHVFIGTDDPAHPEAIIPLTGQRAYTPDIALYPDELLFEDVCVGGSWTLEAEICNEGDGSLKLGILEIDGSEDFTLAIDPSGTVLHMTWCTTVAVTYTPSDESPDLGEVVIPSNDPDENPAYIRLFGRPGC